MAEKNFIIQEEAATPVDAQTKFDGRFNDLETKLAAENISTKFNSDGPVYEIRYKLDPQKDIPASLKEAVEFMGESFPVVAAIAQQKLKSTREFYTPFAYSITQTIYLNAKQQKVITDKPTPGFRDEEPASRLDIFDR